MSVEWKTDPSHGNFNPGTAMGHKIFLEKTKGLEVGKRFDLTKANAMEIRKYLLARESNMGDEMRKIPIEWDGTGTVTRTANLLSQYHLITLEDLQRASHARFNTSIAQNDPIPAAPFTARTLAPATDDVDKPIFYSQVECSVINMIIKNGISASGYSDLLLKKDQFAFHDDATGQLKYDGPTMVFLMFQKIDPNTVVGMDSVLKRMEGAKLGDFANDVDRMLSTMEGWYRILQDNQRPPENYRRLLLDALITGPNHVFNEWIQRITDDIEAGFGTNVNVPADKLIIASRTKFNNMSEKQEWAKVDPRDAQIMALHTKLEALSKAPKHALATTTGGGKGGKEGDLISGLPKWRTVKDGEKKTIDGTQYWWCPHHKHKDGLWDGLYVRHPEEKHAEIMDRFAKKKQKTEDSGVKKEPGALSTLELQENMKRVLVTNLMMSEEDVGKLLEQASEN